jgi:hypothetical protein
VDRTLYEDEEFTLRPASFRWRGTEYGLQSVSSVVLKVPYRRLIDIASTLGLIASVGLVGVVGSRGIMGLIGLFVVVRLWSLFRRQSLVVSFASRRALFLRNPDAGYLRNIGGMIEAARLDVQAQVRPIPGLDDEPSRPFGAPSPPAPAHSRSFAYDPQAPLLILAVAICLASTAFMAGIAGSNDTGLIISGLIKLGVASATMFEGLMAALCLGGAVLAIVALIARLRGLKTVSLSSEALSAPGRFLSEAITVPINAITSLSIEGNRGRTILNVHHQGGKVLLAANRFASKQDFETFVQALRASI